MASGAALIGEASVRYANKFPVVTVFFEREFQHAVFFGVNGLAIGFSEENRAKSGATGADDELSDSIRFVFICVAILQGETLKMMIVS